MIKLLTTLFLVFSFIGCAGIPKPDTDLCIVNAPNQNRKCYNLARDYRDDGALKAGAVPVYKNNSSIQALNKALVIDSPTGFEDGLAHLKAYIKKLREAVQECSSGKVLELDQKSLRSENTTRANSGRDPADAIFELSAGLDHQGLK